MAAFILLALSTLLAASVWPSIGMTRNDPHYLARVQRQQFKPPQTKGLMHGMVAEPGDINYQGTGSCEDGGSRILRKAIGINPEQLHLTPWTPTSMLVSWAAGQAMLGPGPATPAWSPDAVQAVVEYGTDADNLSLRANGSHNNVVYQRRHVNVSEWGLTYSSPILCHVLLPDLQPGRQYFYRVGDPIYNAWSSVRSFYTLPPASSPFPLSLAIVADVATSVYTAINVDNMLLLDPDVVLLAGDLPYADLYQDNGTLNFIEMPETAGSLKNGTNQPGGRTGAQTRWDDFGRLWEPLISRVPFLCTGGNHEIEPGKGPEPVPTHQAYNARFPMPAPGQALPTAPNSGGSPRVRSGTSNSFYATELPGAYLITLTQYYDYTNTSEQYAWFIEVASQLDRSRFPWLLVMHHLPLYNTLISHYVEGECFRKIFEPLFFKFGVDFVLTGHAHGYERTYPLYNYSLDKCGFVHGQVGSGGQDAKQDYIDGPLRPAYCSNASAFPVNFETWYPAYKAMGGDPMQDDCRIPPSFVPVCPEKQPEWSAFRTPTYGFVHLNLKSADEAEWEFVVATPGGRQKLDRISFQRRPETCSNSRRAESAQRQK